MAMMESTAYGYISKFPLISIVSSSSKEYKLERDLNPDAPMRLLPNYKNPYLIAISLYEAYAAFLALHQQN
jgi:hypothetical protein